MNPIPSHPPLPSNHKPPLRRLLPFLVLPAALAALAGVALTVLLPSQMLKPDALRAQALVERSDQEILDRAMAGFPKETTAYIAREECWTEGKTLCIYGWYAEWKGAVYLMSYTLAAEEEDRLGRLRGLWWEVDIQKEAVRPLWRFPDLQKKYRVQETDAFRDGGAPDRPVIPPLLKIP